MSTTPVPWGTELLVNTTTTSIQSHPAVAALADGRYVVAWHDYSESGGDPGYAVRAQIFNADGSKTVAEIHVNTGVLGNQTDPTITALADGGFVVAWTDGSRFSDDRSGLAVRAQAFHADGSKAGTELLVNTTTTDDQCLPTITALADGGFVVAWADGSTTYGAVLAQVFSGDASKVGPEFRVNITAPYQFSAFPPSIAALADGRFVVAWDNHSHLDDDPYAGVRARVIAADGSTAGPELLLNTTTTGNQTLPAVAALTDGRFVAAWTDYSQSGGDIDGSAVRAQIFTADGAKVGAELLVNTTTTDVQTFSTVTGLIDGRFVVTWTDYSESGDDTSGSAVRAQVFTRDGTKAGAEFLVNTTTSNGQGLPTIAGLADGRFVVAWADGSQTGGDTSNSAVRGQIFDPREAAVQLQGSIGADDYVGTIWGDVLWGGFGNDRLAAGAGSDLVCGDAGDDTLKGEAGNDRLYGGDGTDSLLGGLGSDELHGDGGHDRLDGGLGSDALLGGPGNDVQLVDTMGDLVLEHAGEGFDTVQSATISLDLASYPNVEHATVTGYRDLNLTGNDEANTLTGNAGNNVLVGGRGIDTASYLSAKAGVKVSLKVTVAQNTIGAGVDALQGIERLLGSLFDDQLGGSWDDDIVSGQSGNDLISGLVGNDTLLGGKGHDRLSGGRGNDSLSGDVGRDVFRFDAALDANTNRDTITDFSAVDDTIELENAIFASLATIGVLASENFVASNTGAVVEADDFIFYNVTTGALYYDADGSGIEAAVQFATFTSHPAITHADFTVT